MALIYKQLQHTAEELAKAGQGEGVLPSQGESESNIPKPTPQAGDKVKIEQEAGK